MDIKLAVPDEIVQQLKAGWDDLPGRALEALAVEGYLFGLLTSAQVQQMLNHQSRWETVDLPKAAERLRKTDFPIAPALPKELLERHGVGGSEF